MTLLGRGSGLSRSKRPPPPSARMPTSHLVSLWCPSIWSFYLSSAPISTYHFFLLSSLCLSFLPSSTSLFFPPLPFFTLSPCFFNHLYPLFSPPSSSLTASATNPRSHSPVDFYDPPDRETMRLQKFGKLLAGPNTDLGKSCQSLDTLHPCPKSA